MSTKTDISFEDLFKITTEDTCLSIEFIEPVVYSSSHSFNNLSIRTLISQVKNINLIINPDLVFDSFLFLIIKEFKEYCSHNGVDVQIVSYNSNFDSYYSFLDSKPTETLKKIRTNPVVQFFEDLGLKYKKILDDLFKFVQFFGAVAKRFFLLPTKLNEVRWVDLPGNLIQVGVNSLGICLLIVFLIGIIIGYVGAIQLQRFGVGSFLASLVGIAVTRELSPIMVGIIMAGRTGSAFTAEIGTMKVSEEIDALHTFGFDKYYFLVFPRVIAITLALPILVSICNIVGILGGFVAGNWVLSIGFREFQMQLLDSTLSYWDVISGILKSSIFGFIIGVVGCFKGFQVSGGAESVGRYTTSSVVTAIFLIVFVDAIFSFLI